MRVGAFLVLRRKPGMDALRPSPGAPPLSSSGRVPSRDDPHPPLGPLRERPAVGSPGDKSGRPAPVPASEVGTWHVTAAVFRQSRTGAGAGTRCSATFMTSTLSLAPGAGLTAAQADAGC